jgi:transcriptional regulator with XRE-family HTH domain
MPNVIGSAPRSASWAAKRRTLTLAERLQACRLAAGFSQAQLAEASGVPVETTRGLEMKGGRVPSLVTALKLASVFGMTAEALLDCGPGAALPAAISVRRPPGAQKAGANGEAESPAKPKKARGKRK